MKKILLTALSAFALIATSCSSDEDVFTDELPVEQESNEVEFVLSATMEDYSSTRATVDVDGSVGTFKWAMGDTISLLMSSGKFKPLGLLPEYDGATTGKFKGMVSEGETAGAFAIYPYSANHTETTAHLAAEYGDAEAEYTENTNALMRAEITEGGSEAAFNHLAGVLRIQFAGVPAGTDRFVFAANGKNITGDFTIVDNEGNGEVQLGDGQGSGSTVKIKFKATAADQAMTFYVPLPVGTYQKFTVELKQGDATLFSHTVNKSAGQTISRGSLSVMPELTFTKADEGYYSISVGSKTSYIVYDEDDLLAVNTLVQSNKTANITLMDNITLTAPAEGGSNWTPISGYNGTINGNGKSISGLVINQSSEIAGFVHSPENGIVVKGLTFINPIVATSGSNAAVIVGGQMTGGTIIDCHVIGGSLSGLNLGTMVSLNSGSSKIIACSVDGTQLRATGNYAGGLAFQNTRGAVMVGCYAKNVDVSTTATDPTYLSVGGLVGSNSSGYGRTVGKIYGCYSEGCIFVNPPATTITNEELQNLFGKHENYSGYGDPITYDSYYKKDDTYSCVAGIATNVAVTSTTTDWAEAASAMNAAIASSGVECDYRWDTNEVKLVKTAE